MRLRRPLPAVQGDTLHIVGVGDNRIGKNNWTPNTSTLLVFTDPKLGNTEIALNAIEYRAQNEEGQRLRWFAYSRKWTIRYTDAL